MFNVKTDYRLIKNVFSFETLFVLFLFSSQFKNAYPFSLLPDITLLLVVILLPWSVILYRKNSKPRLLTVETTAFLLFSLWCLVSALWAQPTSYSISKALCFSVYTVPAFFMAYFVIGADQARLKRFLFAIIILSIWVCFEAYKEFILSGWQIVDVLGNNYLVTGQTLGCGFILLCLFAFFTFKENSNTSALFYLLMFLCGTYAYIQLHLGGRGPVLGAILTLFYFYVYGLCNGEKQLYNKYFIYLIGSCFLVYMALSWLFDPKNCHFLTRTYKTIDPHNMDESISLRIEYYKSAISAFLKHPLFGLGFGGWALFHDTLYHYVPFAHDLRDVLWWHPHNIGLEILAETGVIGGLLGIWFGFLIFKKTPFKLMTRSFLDAAAILLLAFSLFNMLKSGDLNDNILFFVMAGIVAAKERLIIKISK